MGVGREVLSLAGGTWPARTHPAPAEGRGGGRWGCRPRMGVGLSPGPDKRGWRAGWSDPKAQGSSSSHYLKTGGYRRSNSDADCRPRCRHACRLSTAPARAPLASLPGGLASHPREVSRLLESGLVTCFGSRGCDSVGFWPSWALRPPCAGARPAPGWRRSQKRSACPREAAPPHRRQRVAASRAARVHRGRGGFSQRQATHRSYLWVLNIWEFSSHSGGSRSPLDGKRNVTGRIVSPPNSW